MTRWSLAASFSLGRTSRQVYEVIKATVLADGARPDIACYRALDPLTNRYWVAVIGYEPNVMRPEDAAIVRRELALGKTHPPIDGGMLDAMYADWETKRGSGPPLVEDGRMEAVTYTPRGPEGPPKWGKLPSLADFLGEAQKRALGGPCACAILDYEREVFYLCETEEEAEKVLKTLPPANYIRTWLHAENCTHPEAAEAFREDPEAAILRAMNEISQGLRQTPN